MNTKIKAYAKVNLHLQILNKREDAYHNIFGLFAKIDLYDILKIEKIDINDYNNGKIDVEIKNSGGVYKDLTNSIPISENLITKASKLLLIESKKSGKIKFSLIKNIPAGAGLAGGSSDAAAALKLLNKKITKWDTKKLIEIGTKLGADIPFCLTDDNISICEGIGDITEKIKTKLNYHLLILNNGIEVNTGDSYNLLNRDYNYEYDRDKIIEKKGLIRKLDPIGKIDNIKKILTNDFEKGIFELYPELKDIKNSLNELDADYSTMTGTGSTIIGLFKDKKNAYNAHRFFEKKIKFVKLTNFI